MRTSSFRVVRRAYHCARRQVRKNVWITRQPTGPRAGATPAGRSWRTDDRAGDAGLRQCTAGGCFITGHIQNRRGKWRVNTVAQPGDPTTRHERLPVETASAPRRGSRAASILRRTCVLRHRSALSVDRRDARHYPQEGGLENTRFIRMRRLPSIPIPALSNGIASTARRHLGHGLCL